MNPTAYSRGSFSIRDLIIILETIADSIHTSRDIMLLTEHCRMALAYKICDDLAGREHVLYVFHLDHEIEKIFLTLSQQDKDTSLDSNVKTTIFEFIEMQIKKFEKLRLKPIALCDRSIRSILRGLTEKRFPRLNILSFQELMPNVRIKLIDQAISDLVMD